MSKEIARFQLTSGVNNLERWVIPDNVNVITENTDSTHYTESYQHKFYNSAIINFDTSLYGYLWASSMLLFDASCQITVERSTNGGSTWSSYRTTNCQTLRGSFYTLSGGDSGIGGTYWINMNSNDAQCISSVLPICNNATDFNNAVTNVYVPEITSGGAGSGYIGNALVSNKKMVGYNVPTSSAESTKTESVEEASESPVSGKTKIGNGHVRIKLLRGIQEYNIYDLLKNKNLQDINQYSLVDSAGATEGIFERLPDFVGTDTILGCYTEGLPESAYTPINYNNGIFDLMIDNSGYGYACIPMTPMYITKISYECKIEGNINQDFKIAVVTDDAYDTHGPDSGENSLRFPNPIQVTDWTYKEYVFTANDRSKIWTYFLVNRNGVGLKIRNVKIYGTPVILE